VGNFRPFLRGNGVELTHHPTLSDDDYAVLRSAVHPGRKALVLAQSASRAARAGRYDGLLLVHRLVLLTPFPGIDPAQRLDAYDLDDALTIGSPADRNRRFQWVKREAERAATSMRRARLVIAGNPFLASQARQFNKRVEIVPSCVDPSLQPVRNHADQEVVTIGWIGSHTTVEYLQPILPVVAALNRSRQLVRMIVVGGDTGWREPWIEHRPWSLERQSEDLASFDIGVMPLPESDWARGKSGYKVLQYFAAGVPAVASPVGVNAELVSGERGLLARSLDEWKQALAELIADAGSRRELGVAARAFVDREYSYERWAPELAAMLRALS
jgi:glycosyltransferase involved in cell wall biosynthesis